MNFSQIAAEFQKLKGQFEAGALTEAEFKARLQELMLQDEQGRWWMIGYETGQWYYHDGEKWVQSEPPKPAPVAPPAPVVELRRVRKLFRGFLLHFLPTVVAGVLWGWMYYKAIEYLGMVKELAGEEILWGWPSKLFEYQLDFNALFAMVAAFVAWLVLSAIVTRWWQMVLALAVIWEVASRPGLPEKLSSYGVELAFYLALEVAIIFALGLGFSLLFTKMLGSRLSIEP